MQIKTRIAIFIFIATLGYSSFATAQEQVNQTSDLNSILKLAEMGDKRAVKLLIAIIKDKDKNGYTRKQAATALAKLGSLAIEPLIDTLNTDDPIVRRLAVEALGNIQNKRIVDPLIKVLVDQDIRIRRLAVDALAASGDMRVLKPLINIYIVRKRKARFVEE